MNFGPLLRVLFVCRGSRRDGLGHVMRTRCVAAQMARRSSVRVAVLGEPFVDNLLAGRGLDYRIVGDDRELLEVHRDFRPHVVVFDALTVSDTAFESMAAAGPTISLSPIFDHLESVDLVFHRTEYFGEGWGFGDGRRSDGQRGPEVRRGLQYAVIREQCLPIDEATFARSVAQRPLAVVISMGGADAHNKTLATLRAIGQVRSPLLIWTLLGEGYGHSYEKLVECVRENRQHEIILAKTSDSMWRVMQTCALAILAGGTITYEAAFAGLPSINVFDDGAHVFLIRELVEKGISIHAGYPFDDALNVVAAHLSHLESHRDELLEMHRKARGAIDGRGAARIADEIVDFVAARLAGSSATRGTDSSRRSRAAGSRRAATTEASQADTTAEPTESADATVTGEHRPLVTTTSSDPSSIPATAGR